MAQGDIRNRQGIRQVNADDYTPLRDYTPHSQQTMESHVLVPLAIAAIVALFITIMVSALMVAANFVYAWISFAVWSVTFLYVFLWRIGVGDSLLWKLEEFFNADINGDGEVGFLPRTITHNSNHGSREIEAPVKSEKLSAEVWGRIAVALLNECQDASRRGLCNRTQTVKITQGEASTALAAMMKAHHVIDNGLTAAGWDWLIVFLPTHTQCRLNRPSAPPTAHPPTLSDGG